MQIKKQAAHLRPNEKKLSHRCGGERRKHRELFHKINVGITTASGWLERLVRCLTWLHEKLTSPLLPA